MTSETVLLERERRENRVLGDLCRLAATDHAYVEVVQAILSMLEDLVASPLLCLSVREAEKIAHYARAGEGVDPDWAQEAARGIADAQERWLAQTAPGGPDTSMPGAAGAATWFRMFSAWSRSGRGCALALGASQPIEVTREQEHLMSRIVAQVLLVLEHALLLEQVEELQLTDGLTGAANLRRLLDVLDHEMRRHRYEGHRLALLLVDVEGLDGINRSYGRHYGNHILNKVATMLQEAVRPIDLVARCGLDEFAVVLPGTDAEQALHTAEALRDRFLGVEFAGGEIGLTLGVAHVKPEENLTPEEFLRRAEQALHQEKRQRRAWPAALRIETQRVR